MQAEEANILTLNGGSSSLKFAVYRLSAGCEEAVLTGAAEAIGAGAGRFWLRKSKQTLQDISQTFSDHSAAIKIMFAALRQQGFARFSAAGHRIVHGGRYFREPQCIDANVINKLKELVMFAPLHLPPQIALIEGVTQHYSELKQVACFDTAFHWSMPEIARRFPLPRKFWDEGVMRYGFHGLSYEYIVSTLGDALGGRAIIAHLGNGASMVAVKDRRPIDTSMGLTPTGGFMMGTRSGDLDPGVLLFLLRKGCAVEELATILDYHSGLLGVSGLSSDMKTLLEARAQDPDAGQAVEMFCYQVRKFIGAYAAALGGLDTLVFTGGIGERAAEVRATVLRGLRFLGIEMDEAANARHSEIISSKNSPCSVRVIKTDEDLMIARHTRRLIQS
jgi:acetate kinase